jgi:hypothetical protein
MKIAQNDDGSIDITFSDKDLKACKNNNNTIHIDQETTKHCLNILVQFVSLVYKKLPEKVKKIMTPPNHPLIGREK